MNGLVKALLIVGLLAGLASVCYFVWKSMGTTLTASSNTLAPLSSTPSSTTTTSPTLTPLSAAATLPATPTVTFYTGKQGSGGATPITSLSQLFSFQGALGSAAVSNGGSFIISSTAADGTVTTWAMASGQAGFSDAPAALTGGSSPPKSISYTINGQSQSIAPNGGSATALAQVSSVLAAINKT